jgi:glycosyltransferase involved in cell wall biosynthesis
MRICYFGRETNTQRGYLFLKGLRLNGVDISEINYTPSLSRRLNYVNIFVKSLKSYYDAIIVGFDRWLENFFAKLRMRNLILWDAFMSHFDTYVFDRKLVNINSRYAKYLYYRELFTLKCADVTILDTNAHIDNFKDIYPTHKGKYGRVFVGADDAVAYPQKIEKNSDKFIVFFIGSYIPLHGIEYIIEAAKELEDDKEILFVLVGTGQTYELIQKKARNFNLSNVNFIPSVPYPEAIKLTNQADICLGIFGTSRKAKSVIPSKVYDALATAKPIVTGDSPASRELLKNEENSILCEMANGKAIANAIRLLKEDKKLREKIASNGYKLFKEQLTPKHIGHSIIEIINNYQY